MYFHEESTENNMIESDTEQDEYEYKFNFVNTPWDDRTYRSKFGIVALLIGIFLGTMACIVHNLAMHYKAFRVEKFDSSRINCHLLKVEDLPYVARIQSISTQEVICLGAVVGTTLVLASEICLKSGPVRLRLGSPKNLLCRKGFPSEIVDIIFHDGIISKRLVVLTSYESFNNCIETISVGTNLSWTSRAFIIGRPLHGSRSLSSQPVKIVGKGNCTGPSFKSFNVKSTICVKDFGHCPVRAGDLLVQNGRLFGLASTSIHGRDDNNIAYFADLEIIRNNFKDIVDE